MKPIKEKVQKFLKKKSECMLQEIHNGRCMDYKLSSQWYLPEKMLPPVNEEVLCFLHTPTQKYAVMKYYKECWWEPINTSNTTYVDWIITKHQVLAWKPIHELK